MKRNNPKNNELPEDGKFMAAMHAEVNGKAVEIDRKTAMEIMKLVGKSDPKSMSDFMAEKGHDHRKVIKSVPAKKEWIQKRDELVERANKLKNEKRRLEAERELLWSEIEDAVGGHNYCLQMSEDDKEIEFYEE